TANVVTVRGPYRVSRPVHRHASGCVPIAWSRPGTVRLPIDGRAVTEPGQPGGAGRPKPSEPERIRPRKPEESGTVTTTAPRSPVTPVRVPAGTTAGAAVREAGLPTKGPDTVVVVRDAAGDLKDLSWAPELDTEVIPVAANTEDGRSVIRHSAAHVLAQAAQQEFPEAVLGIGPPIKDGFYYDFRVDRPFTPQDLAKLETRMKKIVKGAQRFSRRVVEVDQARIELAKEPFKLELIGDKSGIDDPEIMEVGGNELTIYDNLDPRSGERVWGDLCRGPHIPTT